MFLKFIVLGFTTIPFPKLGEDWQTYVQPLHIEQPVHVQEHEKGKITFKVRFDKA